MPEDLSYLLQFMDIMIMGICLVVGYVIKNYIKFIPNNAIPVIVTILGLAISIVSNIGNINQSVILVGLISGLASTGAHQLFKTLFKLGEDKDK